MEYQQIKTLLERYFQGESSLEEERSLRQYFSGSKVDERLREYSPMFKLFAQEQNRELDKATAESLWEQLPKSEATQISLSARRLQWLGRIAAMLIVAVGIWWAYQNQHGADQTAEVDWSKYEITDEMEALKITRGALFKVSSTLNEGAGKVAGKLDRMQEIGKFFK